MPFVQAQSITWDTSPSASLGSNQVDFGGITSLLSATAINWSMRVGCSAKATAISPESTRFSSSARPLAADERARWDGKLKPMEDEWVKEMSAKGLPAAAYMKRLHELRDQFAKK